MRALLALEDGSLFHGDAIGIAGRTVGEVVFNTAMTGYQEILTDPSYYQQIVTLTYPHIGNVGTNAEDTESRRVFAAGLVIRDLPLRVSNWRSQWSLPEYLAHEEVVAIANIDTRRLTRLLREKGALRGAIVCGDSIDDRAAVGWAGEFPGLKGADLAKEVTVREPYRWDEGSWSLGAPQGRPPDRRPFKVVAYDFGVKRNILRLLVDRGCDLTVVPARYPATEALRERPDGIFLSNGPGDPEPCEYALEAIREFLSVGVPVFGICLGHQLLGLASGARTVKMKNGHHGANHPVLDLESGRVMITSQNHGFAVDEASLPDEMVPTHRSLFDGTLQGIRHRGKPVFGFQGHPEASPGPHDIQLLFDRFIENMKAAKG